MHSDRHRNRSPGLSDSVSTMFGRSGDLIHTVTTIVAASTAHVIVVVVGIALYGLCQ